MEHLIEHFMIRKRKEIHTVKPQTNKNNKKTSEQMMIDITTSFFVLKKIE